MIVHCDMIMTDFIEATMSGVTVSGVPEGHQSFAIEVVMGTTRDIFAIICALSQPPILVTQNFGSVTITWDITAFVPLTELECYCEK